MKKRIGLSVGFAFLFLAGCAPAIIQPKALVSPLSYQAAYVAVVQAISVQPYPAGTSGWLVTRASKTDGFIATRLSERRCGFMGFGPFPRPPSCYEYRSFVSITLATRADGKTEVNIGTNGTGQALALAASIKAALQVSETTPI